MREYPGGSAELQQRDVLAFRDRTRQLRLHVDDLGVGEPTNEIDVVHGKVDDHADVGHAWGKWSDSGDCDGKNVLAADRVLKRFDGRVEPLDVAHHQSDAGVPCCGDDCTALFHRRCDRLLHQDMNAALDAAKRQFSMQMRGGSDGDGIDTFRQQRLHCIECRAPEGPRNEVALLVVGVGHAHERHTREIAKDTGMVAAHYADAYHADA